MDDIELHIENGRLIRVQDFKKAVNFKNLYRCLGSEDGDFDSVLGIASGHFFRPTYLNETPFVLDGHRICLSTFSNCGSDLFRR
jgi:hypothetical protein